MTRSLQGRERVHFVGVGGIGMSALARLLLARGHPVSGSDLDPGEQGKALARLGADVFSGHRAEHVDGAELVVVTSAIRTDNPEVQEARDRHIPVVKRSELLGAVVNAGRGVAVAGTHGKTTTSALVGHILIEAGLDPTVLIGGVSLNLGSNARVGRGDVVVAEADEYDASFLRLRPEVAVITNVEPDHLDFYHTVERLHAAFRDFSRGVAGTLVVCADDPILPELVGDLATRVVTYSLHGGDWRAWNVAEEQDRTLFRAEYAGVALDYAMGLAGLHNVRNALAALVVADTIGVSRQRAAQALATFRGVERRFQLIGEAGGVLVIDDYAHHPTEMRASLCALRQRFGRTLRLVFQPHTYSRTRALMQDFAEALRGADAVYLLDIYPARETDTLGVSGRDLYDAARQSGASVAYAETIDGALKALLREVQPGDLVVTMGAGDVYRLGPRVLEELRSR